MNLGVDTFGENSAPVTTYPKGAMGGEAKDSPYFQVWISVLTAHCPF